MLSEHEYDTMFVFILLISRGAKSSFSWHFIAIWPEDGSITLHGTVSCTEPKECTPLRKSGFVDYAFLQVSDYSCVTELAARKHEERKTVLADSKAFSMGITHGSNCP